MNGDTALKYARSRKAYGPEGSDFARSKRQQKVLVAIKEKIMSQSTYLNPKKILDLLTAVGNHVKTDFQITDLIRLSELAKEVDTSKIINKNFDNSTGGLLVSSSSKTTGYILQPRTGNYQEIQAAVRSVFAMVGVKEEKASIGIYNGTWSYGVATQLGTNMKNEGYNVAYTGNAANRNTAKTQIIDYSGGAKSKTIESLEKKFGVTATTGKSEKPTYDIKIIIGSDYTGS